MQQFPYQHLTRLASLVGIVSLVSAGANALPAATASAQASELPTTEPNSGLNLQSIAARLSGKQHQLERLPQSATH